jgi:hypothetical protein
LRDRCRIRWFDRRHAGRALGYTEPVEYVAVSDAALAEYGRAPTAFADFARRHAAAFGPGR